MHKVKGGRRRAASDTSSSMSSSRSSTSIKAAWEKRRRQRGRQDEVLERHRHRSVSGVPGAGAPRAGAREEAPRDHGTGKQVQEGDGERDDDEDATDSRPDIQARLRRAPEVIVADDRADWITMDVLLSPSSTDDMYLTLLETAMF